MCGLTTAFSYDYHTTQSQHSFLHLIACHIAWHLMSIIHKHLLLKPAEESLWLTTLKSNKSFSSMSVPTVTILILRVLDLLLSLDVSLSFSLSSNRFMILQGRRCIIDKRAFRSSMNSGPSNQIWRECIGSKIIRLALPSEELLYITDLL